MQITRPASDAQIRYVIALATRVYALPTHEHHALPYRVRRQYAIADTRGMTANQASTSIDAMLDRLAREN